MARAKTKAKTVKAEPVPAGEKRVPRSIRYTPELAEAICWEISQGSNYAKVAAMDGMPSVRTMHAWQDAHDEFRDDLAKAREARAEIRANQIDEIAELLKAGKLDPASARVMSDNLKWLAAKENPRRYGDKLQLDVNQAPLSDMNGEELDAHILKLSGDIGLLPSPKEAEADGQD